MSEAYLCSICGGVILHSKPFTSVMVYNTMFKDSPLLCSEMNVNLTLTTMHTGLQCLAADSTDKLNDW